MYQLIDAKINYIVVLCGMMLHWDYTTKQTTQPKNISIMQICVFLFFGSKLHILNFWKIKNKNGKNPQVLRLNYPDHCQQDQESKAPLVAQISVLAARFSLQFAPAIMLS